MAQPTTDYDLLLTDDQRKAMEAEASKTALKELEAEAKKQYLEAAIARKKRELAGIAEPKARGPELMVDVFLNLAPNAPCLTIDGRTYAPGRTYKFPESAVPSIHEMMYRGWAHEAEIKGTNTNVLNGRRPQNLHLHA